MTTTVDTTKARSAAAAMWSALDQRELATSRQARTTTDPDERAELLLQTAAIFEQQARVRPDLGGRATEIQAFQRLVRREAREVTEQARMETLRARLIATGLEIPDPLPYLDDPAKAVAYVASLFERWLLQLDDTATGQQAGA